MSYFLQEDSYSPCTHHHEPGGIMQSARLCNATVMRERDESYHFGEAMRLLAYLKSLMPQDLVSHLGGNNGI